MGPAFSWYFFLSRKTLIQESLWLLEMKKITMATGLLFRYMTTKIHYIHKIIGKYVNEKLITYPHYKKEKGKTL